LLKNTHVPVMFWRSVGSSQNAFAVESFIDEVAHAAGRDPLAFRRALLADKPDFLAVLDKLAEKGEWGKPMPKGSAQGVAIHESFGTIVGEIVEVAVSDKGEVKVGRVVACVDCGHVVNPLTVEMQIESGVIYGLTAALFGEITIRDGRVEQGNFDTYTIARMADAPVIETHFALSGGAKWGGVGEPGTPPIAPAVANAIFAATGKRIRSLPLKNASLGV
jgi:isoquinoline 1-oxidoreductase beta subunit